MLSVLSPAKSLDFDSRLPTRKHSQPRMLDRASELINVMRSKSVAEISSLMDISEELATLNAERYQDFSTPFSMKNARASVLAFAGDVYQGMAAAERFGERDFTEAQKTVRILSGLYGVLRPLDLMQPYRLEMGTKLRTERGTTLYDWWGDQITDQLRADLAQSPGPQVLINLASKEYFSAVKPEKLGTRVISPRFEDEEGTGRYRVVSFSAKRARGEMATWLVLERARTIKAITDFDASGYRYDADASSPDEPVFRRAKS